MVFDMSVKSRKHQIIDVRTQFAMPPPVNPLAPENVSRSYEDKQSRLGKMVHFLRLKEPSASALADYTRVQQTSTAHGLADVSLQKLPLSVPKVNSKWDGLPHSQQVGSSTKRLSLSSITSRKTYRPTTSGSTASSANTI